MQQTYQTNDKNKNGKKQYVVITNAKSIHKCQKYNNSTTCSKMQKTSQTNNKNNKNDKKQYVVITNAKSIQKCFDKIKK